MYNHVVMSENPSKANKIAIILFIAGGVILFILLVIFILRLVPIAISNIANVGTSLKSGFSSLTNTVEDEEIAITTNVESISAGEPLVVNFVYTPTVPGQYFVSYSCSDGLFYDIQSSNGPKRIICNTPFRLGENIDAISLTPVVTKPNIFIDSTLTIEFKDATGNQVAKGTKLITIKNDSSTTATSTDSNPFSANNELSGSTVTVTPVESKPQTTTTQEITVGRTTPSYRPVSATRDLVVTDIYRLDNRSGLVFNVYNTGNTATGVWEFSYTDAENPSRVLISPSQVSLGAGQGLAVTLQFDGQKDSNQVIAIAVDPYNRISETNENNNSGSISINGNVSGNNGGGGNNGNGSYNPNDDADLVITTLEVGRISGSRFTSDSEIEEDDTAAIRFVVKNEGGRDTGSWRFEITNLPYDRNDTYRSGTYQSLRPGQSLEVIAEFDGINRGDYSIRVEVDSDDDVDEENENNNTRSKSLEVTN